MAKRSSGHSEQVRAALLAAAMRQFLRDGYEVATVRSIASEAGMTTGSLYHFFSSKQGILEEMVRDLFTITWRITRQATAEDACPLVAIGYELAIPLTACAYDQRLLGIYYAAHTSNPISELILSLAEQSYKSLLGQESSSVQSYTFALTAKSLIFGLTQEGILHGRLSMPDKILMVTRALWLFVPARCESPEIAARRITDLLEVNHDDFELLFSALGVERELPGA